MSLDERVRTRLEKALAAVDDRGTRGPRLQQDGRRLWGRVQRLLSLNLIPNANADTEALELACLALQLPMKCTEPAPPGGPKKPARTGLRDRAEDAAELLIGTARSDVAEDLLDRATRLLHEITQRQPMLDEARLLADALNLEDFGATGLFQQAVCLGAQGQGIEQLADGAEKREQYGYWDARLKDGFHFEPVRQMARARLASARQIAGMLRAELRDEAE